MRNNIIILLIMIPFLVYGQILQRSGLPNFNPKRGDAYVWQDTTKIGLNNPFGGIIYNWNGNKWYATSTTIIREQSLPIDTINQNVIINYSNVSWFKSSTRQYYRFMPPSSWICDDPINVDSLVFIYREQRIIGRKSFADTTKFEKGLNSNGKITTIGIVSSGNSNTPSLNLNGVSSEKDTIINSNFVLNGNYGKIGVSNMTSIVNITLPNSELTKNWIFGIRKDDETNFVVNLIDINNNLVYTIRNKMSIEIKNIDGTWKRIK